MVPRQVDRERREETIFLWQWGEVSSAGPEGPRFSGLNTQKIQVSLLVPLLPIKVDFDIVDRLRLHILSPLQICHV